MRRIHNFDDFVNALLDAGFSVGSMGNSDGIFSLIPWGWNETPPYETPVTWHTEDPETDPWEWRMRVLDERGDIAYGKFFFKKSGYITKAWYPAFLAARRRGMTFEEAYAEGKITHFAKRIYHIVALHGNLPLHGIKQLGGFSKEDKSGFDRALTELQMHLFLTMCGRQQKLSQKGVEYGWSSTVFCTTERFFGEEVFAEAAAMTPEAAGEKIRKQVLTLNPEAQEKKIKKFIFG